MRKSITLAVLAVLTLAATQASAFSLFRKKHVADRLGAQEEGVATGLLSHMPIGLVVMGGVVAAGVAASGSDASSDQPASP